MKKYFIILLILSLLPFAFITRSFAATDTTKSPFDIGLDMRYRFEIWDNVFDMNDHGSKVTDHFFRLKESVWAKWNVNENLDFGLKLSTEPWMYVANKTGDKIIKDEMVFDNIYANIKHPFDLPLTFKVGRQDFLGQYDEGFLIMDGTPGDGSRTFYFNAVKMNWEISPDNNLDLVYINDPKYDTFFPVLHDQRIALTTSDEQGVVLYSRNKINGQWNVNPYYIYKREGSVDSTGSILDLHTIGAHASYAFDPWKLHGEYAHQFGSYDNGVQRRGDGGYIFLDHSCLDLPLYPTPSIGFVYLSGDNSNTKTVENWDPLFSRWPWLSELYLLSWVTETKSPGYWTNLQVYRGSVKFKIDDKNNFDVRYNYLRANENTNISGSIFSNNGKERGHLPQIQFNHTFTKNMYGYMLFEYFVPGNFYVSGSDPALFFRTELVIKF